MRRAKNDPVQGSKIYPRTREIVRKRAGGVCEICGEYKAVHMHHLTYERYGKENPKDLLHICILCHMDQHPDKAQDIFEFELGRSEEAAEYALELVQYEREMDAFDEREEARERQREEYYESLRNSPRRFM
jgi:hypothetical protein